MIYRKLSKDLDYVVGRGAAGFWRDVPDAPGQAVLTRLKLELGQWFLDLDDGMPWNTRVLGKYTGDSRDPAIRTRVMDTLGVRYLLQFSSHFNPEDRGYGVNMVIDTVFGQTQPFTVPL